MTSGSFDSSGLQLSRRWIFAWHLCGLLLLPLYAEPNKPAELPIGIYLPVLIPHALRAGRTKPGTVIVARIAQRIPLGANKHMDKGDLIGQVVVSTEAKKRGGKGPVLTIRFMQVRYHNQMIPVTTRALAIANFTDVGDAAVLVTGSTARGNSSPANWTIRQVGGDEVYRSGWVGPVCGSGMRTVGSADFDGV